MYRKLVWLPVLAFLALTGGMALLPAGRWTTAGSFPVAAYYAKLTSWLPANASGDLRLAITFFLTALVPMLAGLALTWYAAFHPGKKATALQTITKYLAVLIVGAQLLVHLYYRASTLATATHAMSTQIAKPFPVLMLISGLPHTLLEMTAISIILSAPLYWLFRGIRVASLQRATFEAWVEIKRLTVPALILLATATALQVWAQPALSTTLLR